MKAVPSEPKAKPAEPAPTTPPPKKYDTTHIGEPPPTTMAPMTEDEKQCRDLQIEIQDIGIALGDTKMKAILKNHDSGVLKMRSCHDPNKLLGIREECKVAIETNAGAVA